MKGSFKKAATALIATAMFALAGSISSHATKIPVQAGSFFSSNLYHVWLPTESGQALPSFKSWQQNIWFDWNGNQTEDKNEKVQTGWLNQNNSWDSLDADGKINTGWLNENGQTGTGWLNKDGEWYYLNSDGQMVTGWLDKDDDWYYLNPDGQMVTGWLDKDGEWYYLNPDGKMATGWLDKDGDWYYLNLDGKMETGWLDKDDERYYLSPDGKMVTGWLNENDIWYYLDLDGKTSSGWLNQGEDWYFLNSDGKMVIDWLNRDGDWYYLNRDGKMVTGWLEQDGNWYYLSTDGKAASGWLDLNGIWYYLYDSGRMAVNTWIESSYVDANGVWIENQIPDQSIDFIVSSNPSDNALEQNTDNTESTESTENTEITENTESTETTDTTESGENVPDHMGAEITTEDVAERLEKLRGKYPDGMYWNHMGYTSKRKDTNYYSETVTSIPCNHGLYGTDYCNSYINYSLAYVIGMQCDGFARKLSDEIFGTDAKKTDYTYHFEAVKVGDYLRYNNVHTVLVAGKDENGILVAECNIGGTCVIRWGRRITREELDRSSSVICFTRY